MHTIIPPHVRISLSRLNVQRTYFMSKFLFKFRNDDYLTVADGHGLTQRVDSYRRVRSSGKQFARETR